jgi:hypothetical protein
MQILPVLPQVDDRIAHQLTRAVVRYIASSFYLEHLNPASA